MAKHRLQDSLLTKIENLSLNEELFVDKSNGYVSDSIHTVKKEFPDRNFKQKCVYTHIKKEYSSLKDFKKIYCIKRIK